MNSDSSIREDPSVPKYITLNMRYTLLTDLFLILIADSVYDSCSRSLLFRIGSHLSLSLLSSKAASLKLSTQAKALVEPGVIQRVDSRKAKAL